MTRTVTIGATGRDFATLQAAVAAIGTTLPASPVADGQSWVFEVYNDTGTAIGENPGTPGITLSCATDSTHTITIRAAAGTGAGGAPNDHTTRGTSSRLYYNPAAGAAFELAGTSASNWYTTLLHIQTPYVALENLQFSMGEGCLFFDANQDLALPMKNCIFYSTGTGDYTFSLFYDIAFENCLFIRPNRTFEVINCGDMTLTFTNCGFVTTGTSGTKAAIISNSAGVLVLNNTYFFNFSANISGTTNVSGNYNATNLASGLPGANSQHSLTFSSQFENVTAGSQDWRLKTGAALIDTGGGTATSADILGTTRSSPDIGPYEVPAASGPQTLSGSALAVTGTVGTPGLSAGPITLFAGVAQASETLPAAGLTLATGIAATALDASPTVVDPALSGGESATPYFVAASHTFAEADTVSVDVPTGTLDGDLMLAFFSADGAFTDITGHADWTPLAVQAYNSGTSEIWYRVAASEPASYTFSATRSVSTAELLVAVLTYRSPNGTPFDVYSGDGTNLPATGTAPPAVAPDVTTTQDGALVLRFVTGDSGTMSPWDTPLDHVERVDTRGARTGGLGTSLVVAEIRQASAGATGTASFGSGTANDWSAFTVVLAPGAPPAQSLAASALAVTETLPEPLLTVDGAVGTDALLVTETIPAPGLSATVTLAAAALAVSETLPAAGLDPSTRLNASALAAPATVPTPGLTPGATSVAAPAYSPSLNFGAPLLDGGTNFLLLADGVSYLLLADGVSRLILANATLQNLAASAVAVTATVGTPSLTAGQPTLAPSAVTLAPSFGPARIGRQMFASALASGPTPGGAAIAGSAANLTPPALAEAASLGAAGLSATVTLGAAALAVTATPGTVSRTVGSVTRPASALATAASFTPAVLSGGDRVAAGAGSVSGGPGVSRGDGVGTGQLGGPGPSETFEGP